MRSHLSDGEVLLATLGEGEIVGEISVAKGVPRTSTVKALTIVETVTIPADVMAELMESYPQVKARIMETVEQRAAYTLRKVQTVPPPSDV